MHPPLALSFFLVVSTPLWPYPLEAGAWSDASRRCALLGTASRHRGHSNSVKGRWRCTHHCEVSKNIHNLWLVGYFFLTPPPAIPFYTCLYFSMLDTFPASAQHPGTSVCRHNTTLSLMEACAASGVEKGVWAKQNWNKHQTSSEGKAVRVRAWGVFNSVGWYPS